MIKFCQVFGRGERSPTSILVSVVTLSLGLQRGRRTVRGRILDWMGGSTLHPIRGEMYLQRNEECCRMASVGVLYGVCMLILILFSVNTR